MAAIKPGQIILWSAGAIIIGGAAFFIIRRLGKPEGTAEEAEEQVTAIKGGLTNIEKNFKERMKEIKSYKTIGFVPDGWTPDYDVRQIREGTCIGKWLGDCFLQGTVETKIYDAFRNKTEYMMKKVIKGYEAKYGENLADRLMSELNQKELGILMKIINNPATDEQAKAAWEKLKEVLGGFM